MLASGAHNARRFVRFGVVVGFIRSLVGLVAALAAALVALPASAATIMLNTGGTGNSAGRTFTDGTVSLHVTGWSLYNGTASAASLGQYTYGLGVSNSGSDEHTIDNNGSKVDFVLLSFSKAVTLQTATFTTGWFNLNDTDASISYANLNHAASGTAYNSSGAAILNASAAQLVANLYSSASVGPSGNSTRNINQPTLVTSNVWLISAKIGDVDTYKDSFKLKGITYDLPQPPPPPGGPVPEPATWAMLILGMGMVGGAMRRRSRARLALA